MSKKSHLEASLAELKLLKKKPFDKYTIRQDIVGDICKECDGLGKVISTVFYDCGWDYNCDPYIAECSKCSGRGWNVKCTVHEADYIGPYFKIKDTKRQELSDKLQKMQDEVKKIEDEIKALPIV